MAKITTLLISLLLLPVPAFACRIGSIPYSSDPRMTRLIVEASASMVTGFAHRPPGLPSNIYSWSSAPEAPLSFPATTPAQVASARAVTGIGSDRIDAGEDVVLVPWGYGMDCRPIIWAGTSWLDAGAVGILEGLLRPEEEWIGGRPTLDVVAASHYPYPLAPTLAYEDGSEIAPWLTVDEYWSLLQLLPEQEVLDRDERLAGVPVLEWSRSNPELARRFPASQIVRHFEYLINPPVPPPPPSPPPPAPLSRDCTDLWPVPGIAAVPAGSDDRCIVDASLAITRSGGREAIRIGLTRLEPLPWSRSASFANVPLTEGTTARRWSAHKTGDPASSVVVFVVRTFQGPKHGPIIEAEHASQGHLPAAPVSLKVANIPCGGSWIAAFFIEGIGDLPTEPVYVSYRSSSGSGYLLVDPRRHTVRPKYLIGGDFTWSASAWQGEQSLFTDWDLSPGMPHILPIVALRRFSVWSAWQGTSMLPMSRPPEAWRALPLEPLQGCRQD